jgi:fatty-acyl-CoA synthase
METPLTPLNFMRRARKLYGGRLAVVDGEMRLTYAQFGERCDRWARGLARLGVGKGDRVATISPNTHQQLEQFYGIPQLGAVIVPMNYRLSADDFVYMVTHSGAKLLCVHSDYLDLIDTVRARMPAVGHFVALEGDKGGWLAYEEILNGEAPVPPDAVDQDPALETDLLAINYTSGTLTHWPMTPADRYLWTLPMFHANGWTFTWTVTAAGAAHICLRRVEAATIYEHVNREQVSHLCAAPTVLISIANGADGSRANLRRGVKVMTAGAPPAAATIERLETELGWEVTHVYGLTETAPFISICEPLPEHAELSAAARATLKARQGVELVTSGELRVVDDHMRDVPRDASTLGEIVARGNVVMRGYYNDPDATASAFRGGWFHSGDAAVVHPDGYVEIRDRFKDVIISGGENISSIEVEAVLLRHRAVLEAAVVGMPHDKWGETPHAFVVLRPGASAAEQELRDFARGVLAHFKVPTAFHFVAELPKTATGKIQKFVLRGRAPAIVRQ